MLEILIIGILVGMLVVGAIHRDRERKSHERSMAALQAAIPKMANIIAEAKIEQHRVLQRMMAGGGTSSVSLERRVVHLQRRGTIKLNCLSGSQLMWLRWQFGDAEHKLLDFWQFGGKREIILTTQKSDVPAWTTRSASPCIKKSAAMWQILTGDRVAFVATWEFEGEGGEIVNIYEADVDAIVAFSEEVDEPHLSHVDTSPQAVEQARAAFDAANRFGPPRCMSVDASRWELGALPGSGSLKVRTLPWAAAREATQHALKIGWSCNGLVAG